MHRRFWFFRVAERLKLPPLALAAVVALLMTVLTPVVESLSSPIAYAREPFEGFVPRVMGVTLVIFVGFLQLAERWAASALAALDSFLGEVKLDPTRHPRAAAWTGASLAVAVIFVVHEINTGRWSRFLSGDWNLFDAWAVIVVFPVVTLAYQVALIVFVLAWRVGQVGAGPLRLDLFDSRRGEPLARFALRLALAVAALGVAMAANAVLGTWALGTSLFFGALNGSTCIVVLWFCTRPITRSMQALKRVELERIRRAIAGDTGALAESPLAHRLEALDLAGLLVYKREVLAAPIWPLDVRQWGRLVLYLVLPPLSWVAAAVVEELVQGRLGLK